MHRTILILAAMVVGMGMSAHAAQEDVTLPTGPDTRLGDFQGSLEHFRGLDQRGKHRDTGWTLIKFPDIDLSRLISVQIGGNRGEEYRRQMDAAYEGESRNTAREGGGAGAATSSGAGDADAGLAVSLADRASASSAQEARDNPALTGGSGGELNEAANVTEALNAMVVSQQAQLDAMVKMQELLLNMQIRLKELEQPEEEEVPAPEVGDEPAGEPLPE